jgi:hypothetical protein
LLSKIVNGVLLVQLGTEGLSLGNEGKLLLFEKLEEGLMRTLFVQIFDSLGKAVETISLVFAYTS